MKEPLKTIIEHCDGCVYLEVHPNQGNFFDPPTLNCAKRVFKNNSWTGSPWEGEDCELKENLPDDEYLETKIKAATPKWKGVDADEFIKNIRE